MKGWWVEAMIRLWKILRWLGGGVVALLVLPAALFERPAQVCESVAIAGTGWVVEHSVRRTCAYLHCEDKVIARNADGRQVTLLSQRYNADNLSIEPYLKGVLISTRPYNFDYWNKSFHEFQIYLDYDVSNYMMNSEKYAANNEYYKFSAQYPPMISLIVNNFIPNFFMKEYFERKKYLESRVNYSFNTQDTGYAKMRRKWINAAGINEDCYDVPMP